MTPPNDYRTLSQPELNAKFDQDGWAERLQNWTRVPSGDTAWTAQAKPFRREVLTKYKDDEGNTRVFLIDYTLHDGTQRRAVRMLRDDAGVQWDAIP